MAIKKTGSPLSSGAESIEPLGGKEDVRGAGKTERTFESALADVAGEIERAGSGAEAESPTRSAFKEIAANSNLDSAEGAMSAVQDSARFLVGSRLREDMRDSEEGKKVTDDLSSYISKDPFMHKKILGILQRLK